MAPCNNPNPQLKQHLDRFSGFRRNRDHGRPTDRPPDTDRPRIYVRSTAMRPIEYCNKMLPFTLMQRLFYFTRANPQLPCCRSICLEQSTATPPKRWH